MGWWIFPTEQDANWQNTSLGAAGSEENLAAIFGGAMRFGAFITAPTVAATPISFNVQVGAFEAIIDGRHVKADASTVTVNASETNADWFFQLVTDSTGIVTSTDWTRVMAADYDGTSDPDKSIRVFRSTSNAEGVTAYNAFNRTKTDWISGEYTGDGTNNRDINLGFRPLIAVVSGSGGTDADIIGISNIYWTFARGFYATSGTIAMSTSPQYVPYLTTTGIRVSRGASGDSLNTGSERYPYAVVV